MPPRLLFGPVSSEFAELNQRRPPPCGDCITFGWGESKADIRVGPHDTWEEICSRLPAGWKPDGVFLHLPYTGIPPAFWTAPVPVIGWAADWPLLWHAFRALVCRCDLALTDSVGVETMSRAGIHHVQAVNFFGCQPAFLEALKDRRERDLDIVFVGNLHVAVQRERLSWLARIARLSSRWRVAIRTGVYNAAYAELLGRARIVFNRSHHGECNMRAFEAAAAGALLVQEAENREAFTYFRPGVECASYTADNLEEVLEQYLTDELLRRQVAEAGRLRALEHTFPAAWANLLHSLEAQWPQLQERAQWRAAAGRPVPLLGRCWHALANTRPQDVGLIADLHAALAAPPHASSLQSALGAVVARTTPKNGTSDHDHAIECFRMAVALDEGDLLARANLAEALAAANQPSAAVEEATQALARLQRADLETPANWLAGLPYPPGFTVFQVEWERAAWDHAGQPRAEARAKHNLLRWRLNALLATLTGKLEHYYEAALARPDLPMARAALGCALARAQRTAEAIPHLEAALACDPFDAAAARAHDHALDTSGNPVGRRRLAYGRRVLHEVAPQPVPAESWAERLHRS